jgi:hypothetical protein
MYSWQNEAKFVNKSPPGSGQDAPAGSAGLQRRARRLSLVGPPQVGRSPSSQPTVLTVLTQTSPFGGEPWACGGAAVRLLSPLARLDPLDVELYGCNCSAMEVRRMRCAQASRTFLTRKFRLPWNKGRHR